MAGTIGLSAYTLRFRKRHSHEIDWLAMSRNGQLDAWEHLHRHLLNRKNMVVKEEQVSRAYRLTRLTVDGDDGTLAGIMEAGDYGRANPIINIASGKTTHNKTVNEADMPPFYFRIHCPDPGTTAVLALQRIGMQGVKSPIEADIKTHFAGLGYTARFATLTDNDLLNAYLTHGEVNEISVIHHAEAADPRDAVKYSKINNARPPTDTKMAITFSRKNGFPAAILRTAASVFRRTRDPRDLVEVYGLENPEDVTFSIEMEGKSKLFRIMHPQEIGVQYDVSQDVKYDADNHPVFESIDRLAKEWCKSLLRKVNTSTDGN
jgi:hypothetical protein